MTIQALFFGLLLTTADPVPVAVPKVEQMAAPKTAAEKTPSAVPEAAPNPIPETIPTAVPEEACVAEKIHSVNTFARAGHPEQVSRLAHPTYTKRSYGYYVGGGAPGKKGEGRYITEGTWGMDYIGWGTPTRRIALGWWHGRRYQGGEGAYKSRAPELPDVPNLVRPIKKPPEGE